MPSIFADLFMADIFLAALPGQLCGQCGSLCSQFCCKLQLMVANCVVQCRLPLADIFMADIFVCLATRCSGPHSPLLLLYIILLLDIIQLLNSIILLNIDRQLDKQTHY